MGSSNTNTVPGGGKADSSADGGDTKSDPSASASVRPAPTYTEGEKVLAFHGPRIYEAKVQKVEFRKTEWKYFVHYTGWNKSWDEWVGTDRLLKFTDENVQKQQALEKGQTGDRNIKSRSSHNKPKGSTDAKTDKEDTKNYGSRGKKRKTHAGIEEKETRSTDKIVPIQLPLTLKKQLVDDWEFVTQLGKLVKLPRIPNVDDILKKYLDYRTKKDGLVSDSLGEILKGIRCYFDKALPEMLLYKKERQQFEESVVGSSSPSSVYGAEHLLRLFVKLPELLAHVNMEEETLCKLQQNLLDFLKSRALINFAVVYGVSVVEVLMGYFLGYVAWELDKFKGLEQSLGTGCQKLVRGHHGNLLSPLNSAKVLRSAIEYYAYSIRRNFITSRNKNRMLHLHQVQMLCRHGTDYGVCDTICPIFDVQTWSLEILPTPAHYFFKKIKLHSFCLHTMGQRILKRANDQ